MDAVGKLLEDWAGWIPILLFGLLAAIELAVRRGDLEPSPLKRIGTNIGLYIAGAALNLATPLTIIGAAAWAAKSEFGLFHAVAAPPLVILTLVVLARSCAAYWLHRASHRIALLWRIHCIHHSDRQVDVSLALRHHPLELVPAILVFAGVVALLGAPVWAVVLTELIMIAASYWEHLAVRLPARVRVRLEPWIVLPETHLLHHSADRSQTDSNYSTLTIVWDRLFGTYRPSSETVARIGLGDDYDRGADSFWRQLVLPLSRMNEQA